MTETLGAHGPSLAETHGLDCSSVLNAIHQRWLERTENGDGKLIMSRLHGASDPEACIALFDGYVARVGAENLIEDRSEADTYLIGRQAVRSFLESSPDEVTISGVIEVLEATYQPGSGAEEVQNGNGQIALKPAQTPAIRRVGRTHKQESIPAGQPIESLRLASKELADQKRSKIAKIRDDLRKGTLGLEEALASPVIEKMAVGDILSRIPEVGEVRRGKALRVVNLAEETHIGTLTDEQKAQLGAMFPKEKYQPKGRKSRANSDKARSALQKANAIRMYRAGLKLELAAGEMSVEELLNDPIGAGMKLREALIKLPTRVRSQPLRVKSIALMDKILDETGLPGGKRCSELTERQRKILFDSLGAHYKEETGTYRIAR